MKASRVVVLALILAFLLAAVSVSPTVAWDKRGTPGVITPPPPDDGDPEPITEGDPWDDNEGGGPEGADIGHPVVIVTPSDLPGWITKFTVMFYKVKISVAHSIDQKVVKKRANISK